MNIRALSLSDCPDTWYNDARDIKRCQFCIIVYKKHKLNMDWKCDFSLVSPSYYTRYVSLCIYYIHLTNLIMRKWKLITVYCLDMPTLKLSMIKDDD